MATTIDNKTVQMNFDNSNFEKNIAQSVKSLQNIEKQIDSLSNTKSLETLNNQANNVDFSHMSNGLDDVKAHFSALQVAGYTIISELTKKVMEFGSNLAKNTVGQIKTGGITRALNIEQAKFQIEGLGKVWDKFNKKGEQVGIKRDVLEAVRGTQYGLDEAAKVSSQLLASDVKQGKNLENILRSIAGVAAMTNSSYGDIGNLYTKIAGNGRLMSQELLQLSAKGTNAAAVLRDYANAHDNVRKKMIEVGLTSKGKGKEVEEFANATKLTEQNIRTLVSAGGVNFKFFAAAMDNAFGKQASKANETYTGSLENVKAALSRIGEPIATNVFTNLRDIFNTLMPIIDGINEELKPLTDYLKTLLNSIGSFIRGLLGKLTVLKKEVNGKETITGIKELHSFFVWFATVFEKVVDTITKSVYTFKDGFMSIGKIVITLKDILLSLFSDSMTKNVDGFGDAIKTIGTIFSSVFGIISKILVTFAPLISSILGLIKNVISSIGSLLGDALGNINNSLTDSKGFTTFSNGLKTIINGISSLINKVSGAIKALNIFNAIFYILGKIIKGVGYVISNIGEAFNKAISAISNFFDRLKNGAKLSDIFKKAIGVVKKGINSVISMLNKNSDVAIRGGILTALVFQIKQLVIMLQDLAASNPATLLMSISQSFGKLSRGLGNFAGAMWSLKKNIQYRSLRLIASAILMLAIALTLISGIPKEKLNDSISTIIALFIALVASFKAIAGVGSFKLGPVIRVLLSVAVAVNILSSALKKLASIKSSKLNSSLLAVTILIAEIVATIKILSFGSRTMSKGIIMILVVAEAVKMLTKPVLEMSKLSWGSLIKGLTGVGIILASIIGFMTASSLINNKIGKASLSAAINILIIAKAINILANVIKDISSLSWQEIGKGLSVVFSLLVGLTGYLAIASKIGKASIKSALSIIGIAVAIKILASIIKQFEKIEWATIGKGLGVIGSMLGGLLIFITLLNLAGGSSLRSAAGILLVAVAIKILAGVVTSLGNLSIGAMIKGLGSFIVMLTTLASALMMMQGTLGGSAALVVASAAMIILSASLFLLSSIPIEGLAAGLVSLALSLLIISKASVAMSSSIPALMGVSVALGILGAGIALLGVGILALALGLDAIIKLIVHLGTGFKDIIVALATGIIEFVKAIIFGLKDIIPVIVDTVLVLLRGVLKIVKEIVGPLAVTLVEIITNVLKSLANNAEPIVQSLIDIIIGIINGVASRADDLVGAIGNLLGSIGAAIVKALNDVNPEKVMKIVLAVGVIGIVFSMLSKLKTQAAKAILTVALISVSLLILTGVFFLLGKVDNSISAKLVAISIFLAVMTVVLLACSVIGPLAVEAIIGLGVVLAAVAAVTLVMIALGALADQVKPFIDKGGPLLIKIGSYIGQFIGAFVAGIAKEVLTVIPALGEALGKFGNSIKPFIDALNKMPISVIVKMAALVGAIIAITGASFLNKITTFLSLGEDPIDGFIKMMIKLGKGLKEFDKTIAGVDATGAESAANVLHTLAKASNLIPSSGGWLQKIIGNKNLDNFSKGVTSLAGGIKSFIKNIDPSIDAEKYTPVVELIAKIAEIAHMVPRSGGWLQNLVGNKDLSGFGDSIKPLAEGIKEFAKQAQSIKNPDAVNNIINIVKKMVEIQNDLPRSGGLWQAIAGSKDWDQLSEGLTSMVDCFKEISKSLGKGINLAIIKTAVTLLQDIAKVNTDAIKITDKADKKGDSETYVSKIIEPVKKAVNKIKEYQKTLKQEDMDGMVGYFKVLKNFINALGTEFSDKETQKNLKIVETVGNTIASLLSSVLKIRTLMTNNTKKGKGEQSLSSQLTGFGNAIVDFSTTMGAMSPTGITMAKNAVDTLKSMSDLKISKFENAKTSVDNLKSALLAFKELNKPENKLTTGKKDKNNNQLGALKKYIAEIKKALTDFAKGLNTKDVKKKLKEISSFGKKMSTFSEGLKAVAAAFDSINKTGVNADKGTAVQQAMANVAKSGIEKFYKGLKGKKSKVEGAFKILLKTTKTVAGEVFTKDSFKTLGQNLIDGMIQGINSRTENLKKSLALQITAGVKVTKKKAKSKSPSKVYDKIGQDLMAGEEQGIIKGGKKVLSALKSVTGNGIKLQASLISSTNVTNSATKVSKNFAKTLNSKMKDSMKKVFYKTGGALGPLFTYFYDTSKFANAKIPKIIGTAQNNLKKAAVALYEAMNPEQAADEKSQKSSLNNKIKKNKKIMNKYKKTYKTYSKKKGKKKSDYKKKHKGAIKRYESAKKRWKQAKADRKDLNKTIRDNRTSAWQDLANTIKDNARSFMDPLAQAIDYGLNLFDKFERGQRISAGRMLANYASNVKGIEKYNNALATLKNKVSPEMYANLKSQGISALPQIEAINRMSNQQLNDLKIYEATNNRQKFENMLQNLKDRIAQAKSWKEKVVELTKRGLNKDALQEILNMGIEEAGPYLNALLSADPSEIKQFNDYFKAARNTETELSKTGQASYAKSATGGVNKAANEKAGKKAAWNYGAGLIKGLKDKKKNKQVSEAAYKLADQVVKAVNKRLGIKSPAKEGAKAMMYVALGMVKGATDNLNLAQNAGEDLANAVLTPLQSIETAQNVIDGNPTITPVLDLDRLERDMSELNDMFNSEYTLGIAADIASNKKLAAQNTKNGDIINNYNNEFTQNNYSPEPLDRVGIYRDTKGWINSKMKGGVATT